VSPLVDIHARLVTQSSSEVFTVRSPRPDYWRLTALDRFDGVAWTSSGTYTRAGGNLATRLPATVQTSVLEQTFTIGKLSALWLPAAFEPAAVVDDGDTGARYEADSGTLTVKEGKETSDGLTYTIQSRIPQRDRASVQAGTTATLPAEFKLRYTDIPSGLRSDMLSFLNDRNTRTLMGLSQGARLSGRSPFEQALLVQNFFRNNFEYDKNVAAGHSITNIDDFLDTRRGHCEQFAGTFAAMMRALGIPARVAVGFTPGELQADGLYHVRGEHAHAWPEVFFGGVGWVRFEPTPDRGAPGDEAYTGVPPAQVEGPITESTAPATTAAPGDPNALGDIPPELDPNALGDLATSGGTSTTQDKAPSSLEGLEQILLVAVIIVLLTVIAVGIVPFLKFAQRRRRRTRASGQPRQEIGLSWAETVDALGLLDLDGSAARTPSEIAQQSAPTLGAAGPDLERLAELTTRATFDFEEPDADEVAAASSAAQSVRAGVSQLVTRRRRALRALDPRPLLPRAQLRG
jgi:transglutaminase-like putative cysteine protease